MVLVTRGPPCLRLGHGLDNALLNTVQVPAPRLPWMGHGRQLAFALFLQRAHGLGKAGRTLLRLGAAGGLGGLGLGNAPCLRVLCSLHALTLPWQLLLT